MIPTIHQAKVLWDTYALPENKRVHVSLVARVALFLAKHCQEVDPDCRVNEPLLVAAALLHDIDKAIPKLPGESHPDAGVRILRKEGMDEVADIVRTHPVHTILDETCPPKTMEEKLLFLSDKMVKYEVITVDKRFALWNAEHLPPNEQDMLDRAYPKVKKLEREIFGKIAVNPDEVANLIQESIL